jgi:hypothetical protein
MVSFVTWSACRNVGHGVDWGWRAERPANPLQVFSHQTHKDVFAREKIECFACHTMTARIADEKDAADAIRASKDAVGGAGGKDTEAADATHALNDAFSGKAACHACHYNPQTGNTAPDRCGLCHADVRDIQPASHNYDWLSRHLVFAKNDAQSCESCHQPRYCQDCHNRRDETVRSYHDPNIRFVHGIEARANPRKCGECHTAGFCQTCHVKGGYEK